MRKKLFTIIAMGLAMSSTMLAEGAPSMSVIGTDGHVFSTYTLIEVVSLKLGETGVIVNLTDRNQEYAYNQILKIKLNDEITTVKDLVTTKVSGQLVNGNIKLQNAPANSSVAIYSVSGNVVCKTTTKADGNATIGLDNLTGGVYILNVGNYTLKFKK